MAFRLVVAAGAAACVRLSIAAAVPCPAGWTSVSAPLTHDSISVADLAFNASASSPQLPIVGYVFYNQTTGSSNIVVSSTNSLGDWATLVWHTPQYAQIYDSLSVRVLGERLYMGVSNGGYASVLRNDGPLSAPPRDGFDGAWAIISTASSAAFAIDAGGDLRALAWQGATTQATTYSTDVPLFPLNFSWLGVSTYGQSGWGASYPATDTWGPFTAAFAPPEPPMWGPTAFDVTLAAGPPPALFGVYVASASTLGVVAFSSRNSTDAPIALGAPIAGASAAPAAAWAAPWLCVSGVSTAGSGATWSVRVWCAKPALLPGGGMNLSAPQGNLAWTAMGSCADGGGSSPASVSLAVTAAGQVLVTVVPYATAIGNSGRGAVMASAQAGSASGVWASVALGPAANSTAGARVRAPPRAPSSSAPSSAAMLLLTSASADASSPVTLSICSLPASASSSSSSAATAGLAAVAVATVAAMLLASTPY